MKRANSSFAVAFISRFHAGSAWRKSLPPARSDMPPRAVSNAKRPVLTLFGLRSESDANISAGNPNR